MRRHWAIVLAAVCLAVTIGAVGYGAGKASDVPKVIQAERFELVDDGRVMAVLGLRAGPPIEPESEYEVRWKRGPTKSRVVVATEERLPYLSLRDAEGRTRMEVALDRFQEPTIHLWDEEGKSLHSVPPVYGMQMME